MRVCEKELRHAFATAPTPTWRAGMGNAMARIDNGTICQYAGTRVVDDKAWQDAMQILTRLPSGGRWVWKFRGDFFYWLGKATTKENAND